MIRGYPGGKQSNNTLQKLINGLPQAQIFIDVFGGSAAVSVSAWKSGKYKSVVYNDKDSQIVDTLVTIRDYPKQTLDRLFITPHSRYYMENVCEDEMKSDNHIIKAAATIYYYAVGIGHTHKPPFFMKPGIRHDNSVSHSAESVRRTFARVFEDYETLLEITLENRDAEKIINRYSTGGNGYNPEKVLFFFDPPYGKTNKYRVGFDDMEMLKKIFTGKWKCAICGTDESLSFIEDYANCVDLSGGSFRAKGSFRQKMILNYNSQLF